MQLNVCKKQREMVLLEESLHSMRSRFNARFLALRSIKREILATVASDNRRLREIDAELGDQNGGGQSLRNNTLVPTDKVSLIAAPVFMHGGARTYLHAATATIILLFPSQRPALPTFTCIRDLQEYPRGLA